MSAKRAGFTVEELLVGHTPPIREIVERLRTVVSETIPDLTERVYPGWHALGYVHPEAKYIGGIFPRAERVVMVFEWGVALPDPDGILTGSGSRTRNVEITDLVEIPERSIVALLQAAVRYGARSTTRS